MATPEFILTLREQIGTARLWLSGATAVVIRPTPSGEEVLLVCRTDNGQWTPVSGIIDPGEQPHLAALREVVEEAGVVAEVENLVWLTVTDVVTYANGDQTQYIDHVFRCRWVSGEPFPADGEATEAAFFAADALPPMTEDHARRVELALADPPRTVLG
ncbi:ADP-ribose pyrophosphatase YjhB (NUDIX family) [Propionicimonas paludicola]|uniref:ADP-ribose pyrophosphatase YjhB (NUDIX family) n=1 Tax=Propionicimonas paludicola TaxID=185243 RepID=A0A2A9CWM1_9ACTN|nr:NUDIX domain-containing protein [Propionicimonas paludicola]PFG18030.1 ADP-ribose pyrophosphatase YjhB (NUDIX family) [Propionicimonas paludicola]